MTEVTAADELAEQAFISPKAIEKNPKNPRRYFNNDRLDLLRTSIQEVGVLVPLIAFRKPGEPDRYVLMDGERRWSSALDLGLPTVPVRLIEPPDDLDNLLRMFNIHAVREDWPLVSVALSLSEVTALTEETREGRLAEMTGLSRSTVRRAKRLLSLPADELARIQDEAHLDRAQQVHREDLYLEVERAESIIRREFPEIAEAYDRPQVIRQFVRKREVGSLKAVTEFRVISQIIAAVASGTLDRAIAVSGLNDLVANENLSPLDLFQDIAGEAHLQQGVIRRSALLKSELSLLDTDRLTDAVRSSLVDLEFELNRLLRGGE